VKNYTEEEVKKLIQDAVIEACKATKDWVVKESIIVDKETRALIPNATVTLKENPKSPLRDYVYPSLEEKGIKITPQS
jgi:hypothetical protein